MKKVITCLLLAALLLAGCSTAPDDATQSTPETADAPVSATDTSSPEDDLPSVQKPMVTVSVPAVIQESAAEDGTVLFRYVYQNMSLIMPDPEVADKIILDFLNRVDKTVETAQSVQAQAEAVYNGSESWTPYLCSVIYSPMRIDQSVLSLYADNILYTGSAHPDYSCRAANYDMVTGDVLTLGSILNDVDSVSALCELVIQKLDALATEKYLRAGYEDTVRQRFAGEESYDENWYFSAAGLCFYFAPYEIAPYSSGVIIAEIPYSELSGIIDDAYFPPEQDTTSGTVEAKLAEAAELEQFTRISEVILDKGAQKILLCADSVVQNVRITVAENAANGEYTVFAAQSIAEGDAIIIEASAETLAALTLSYESNGQTVTQAISIE